MENKERDLAGLRRETGLVRSKPKGTPGRRAQPHLLIAQQRDRERPLTKLNRRLDGLRTLQVQYR